MPGSGSSADRAILLIKKKGEFAHYRSFVSDYRISGFDFERIGQGNLLLYTGDDLASSILPMKSGSQIRERLTTRPVPIFGSRRYFGKQGAPVILPIAVDIV